MTAIQAMGGPSNGVILPLPTFRLMPGEPLASGLQRLATTEIDIAISGFYDGEEVFGEALHTARRSMKRIRGLLRLVRHEIGEKSYRFENAWIRDTARLLSPVRGAAMMVDSLDGLTAGYRSLLASTTFEETLLRLSVRRDRIEGRTMEDPDLLPSVVSRLEKARSRFESWPAHPEAREIYGVGVRDSYEAVGPGLTETFRRGRREMVVAYRSPGANHFHSWRKRVKYLKHQFEILTPVWPEVMIGMSLTLDRIADLLGSDHDLADLLQLIGDRPDLCPDPLERSLMSALAEQRRSDLQTASRILGRRIFAEHPAAFDVRFGAYWESMELARSTHLVSLSA